MIFLNKVIDFLNSNSVRFEENVSMKKYTSFKVGGNAKIMVFPENTEQLHSVVKYLNENSLEPFILGNGSNIVASDEGIENVVIKLSGDFENITLLDDTTLCAGAGVKLSALCNFALSNELSGLEFAYGIPGTVGGAAYMNAGAYGGQMSDVVIKAEHINADGSKGFYEDKCLGFDYRHSVYSNSDKTITYVIFKLKKGNKEEILFKMNDFLQRRKDKQPLNFPSAGSVFKRPEGYFAGALIEQCGLKGKTIGGAQVSEKHAGFIINIGDATCQDIKELVRCCQDTVFEKFGVELKCEIKFI